MHRAAALFAAGRNSMAQVAEREYRQKRVPDMLQKVRGPVPTWKVGLQRPLPIRGGLLALGALVGVAAWTVLMGAIERAHTDHELIEQASRIAERDEEIRQQIRGSITTKQQQQQQQQQHQSSPVLAPSPSSSDPLLHACVPLSTRSWFDPAFVPSVPPPPGPRGEVRVWLPDQDNRTEVCALLPDTQYGTGQVVIVGRRIQAATNFGHADDARTHEGRYIVKPQPQAAADAARAQGEVAPANATSTTPAAPGPPPQQWEVAQLSLLFPHAPSGPLAFVYNPSTSRFDRLVGLSYPAAAAAPLAGGVLATQVASGMGASLATLAPNTPLKATAWAGVIALAGTFMVQRHWLPTQLAFSRRMIDRVRDEQKVREVMSLRARGGLAARDAEAAVSSSSSSSPPDPRRLCDALDVAQTSSQFGTRRGTASHGLLDTLANGGGPNPVDLSRPESTSVGQNPVKLDRSRLLQEYSLTSRNGLGEVNSARLHVEAEKGQSLLARMLGRWRVTKATLTPTTSGKAMPLDLERIQPYK